MVHITIVRHGETPNNVAKIVQSRTDGELTERGERMAKSLGQMFRDENEKFTHIFSSDLKRCRDTTANIISNLKAEDVPEIQYEPLLRERDFGSWEFQGNQVVADKMAEMNLPPYKVHQVEVPSDGETYQVVQKRCSKFLSDILKVVDSNEDANILVVSHGCYICIFLEYLSQNPAAFEIVNFNEDIIRTKKVDNTCRTRFSISRKSNEEDSSKREFVFSHVFDVSHLGSI